MIRSWMGSWMDSRQGQALILVPNGASPSPTACLPKICGWQDQLKQRFPGEMLLDCRLFVSWLRQRRCCAASQNRAVASRGYGSTRAVERTGWSPGDSVGIRAEEAPVNSLRVVGRLQRDSAAPIGFDQG